MLQLDFMVAHSNSGVASPKIWCQNAWF